MSWAPSSSLLHFPAKPFHFSVEFLRGISHALKKRLLAFFYAGTLLDMYCLKISPWSLLSVVLKFLLSAGIAGTVDASHLLCKLAWCYPFQRWKDEKNFGLPNSVPHVLRYGRLHTESLTIFHQSNPSSFVLHFFSRPWGGWTIDFIFCFLNLSIFCVWSPCTILLLPLATQN